MTDRLKVMIVAGEASGDAHAAKVVEELRRLRPATAFEFFGSAGPRMRSVGVEAVVRSDELSIVGLAEIARALPIFLRAWAALKLAARTRRPDAVILVDFPEFNLKLAKAVKLMGFTVIYYISPQLWAWRGYRIATVKKYVDLLLSILPFEKQWYERRGVGHVEYVGSPLAREVSAEMSKAEFCSRYALDPDRPIVSLLPGSRRKEIERILPVLANAAQVMRKQEGSLQFVLAINAGDRRQVEDLLVSQNLSESIVVIEGKTYDALAASSAAAVASGTATLETGIIGTPMVIVYKTSAINYGVFEPMIKAPHYGLINLIGQERIATELIQDDLTPTRLASEIIALLDPTANAAMRTRLKTAADSLGRGGASKRAAAAILKVIEDKKK